MQSNCVRHRIRYHARWPWPSHLHVCAVTAVFAFLPVAALPSCPTHPSSVQLARCPAATQYASLLVPSQGFAHSHVTVCAEHRRRSGELRLPLSGHPARGFHLDHLLCLQPGCYGVVVIGHGKTVSQLQWHARLGEGMVLPMAGAVIHTAATGARTLPLRPHKRSECSVGC